MRYKRRRTRQGGPPLFVSIPVHYPGRVLDAAGSLEALTLTFDRGYWRAQPAARSFLQAAGTVSICTFKRDGHENPCLFEEVVKLRFHVPPTLRRSSGLDVAGGLRNGGHDLRVGGQL